MLPYGARLRWADQIEANEKGGTTLGAPLSKKRFFFKTRTIAQGEIPLMVQRVAQACVGSADKPLMIRHLPLAEEDLNAIPGLARRRQKQWRRTSFPEGYPAHEFIEPVGRQKKAEPLTTLPLICHARRFTLSFETPSGYSQPTTPERTRSIMADSETIDVAVI